MWQDRIFAFFAILLVYEAECKIFPGANTRIVGGQLALSNNTKHQVSIRLLSADKQSFGLGHVCGGSLISPNIVLTAAHCLYKQVSETRKKSEFSVVMGTMDVRQITNETVIRRVSKMIYHKKYNSATVQNDIAILQLNKMVPISNNSAISTIELANQPVKTGMKCQITGWGAIVNNGDPTALLRSADVVVVDSKLCNGTSSYNGKVLPGMFCAGNFWSGGVDSCQGDSGGPFVCDEKLYGIISWGFRCGLRGYPGLYTDVHYYLNWIEKNNSNKTIISLFILSISQLMTKLL